MLDELMREPLALRQSLREELLGDVAGVFEWLDGGGDWAAAWGDRTPRDDPGEPLTKHTPTSSPHRGTRR